jgi:hypothetical protein
MHQGEGGLDVALVERAIGRPQGLLVGIFGQGLSWNGG